MFEQLLDLVKGNSQESIVNNPDVPNLHNEAVQQEATSSIMSTLQGMLGSGGAAQAGNAMLMRAYRLYSAEAQANGDEVLPFEQFQAAAMAQHQQLMAQPQQAAQPGQMPPGGLGTGGGLR